MGWQDGHGWVMGVPPGLPAPPVEISQIQFLPALPGLVLALSGAERPLCLFLSVFPALSPEHGAWKACIKYSLEWVDDPHLAVILFGTRLTKD